MTKRLENIGLIFIVFSGHYLSFCSFRPIGCRTSLTLRRSTIRASDIDDVIFDYLVKDVWSEFKYRMFSQIWLKYNRLEVVFKYPAFSADFNKLLFVPCWKYIFAPVHAKRACRGPRGRSIAPPFLTSALDAVKWLNPPTPQPIDPVKEIRYPLSRVVRWGPESVWTFL